MKTLIERLDAFDEKTKTWNVVVETPKGSRVKYSYDEETGLFALKRALPEGMMFPFNFGFIPETLGEDGDPLDILILNEESLVPGCLLKVQLTGVIKAKQSEDGEKPTRNDRLLGLATRKESPDDMNPFKLDKKTLGQIEQFFVSYNRLDGKKFKVLGQGAPGKAEKIVLEGVKKHRKQKKW